MFMQGLPIDKVGMEGEGLVFVVYSDAIASMPGKYAAPGQYYDAMLVKRLPMVEISHLNIE